MTVIHVPRPPADAQNTNRRLSDLLKAQLQHFRHVEERFISNIKTEGEAARYIRHVTQLLHPEGAEAEAKIDRPRLSVLKPVQVAFNQPKASGITVASIAAQAEETAAVQPPRSGPPAAKARNKAGTAPKKPGKAR